MASAGVLPMPSADFALNFLKPKTSESALSQEQQQGDIDKQATLQGFFADAMATALRDSARNGTATAGLSSTRTVQTHFHGYGPKYSDFLEHQERIHQLGLKNTVSTSISTTLADLDRGNASNVAKSLADSLLSMENLRKYGFDRVNTNEPVIVISIPEKDQLNGQTVRELRDRTRECLKNEHGCAAVRVYVRLHAAETDEAGNFTKLALLNVTNSEIGGPSMVQLLDAFFYSDHWNLRSETTNSIFVGKEAWTPGGWELLWRVEEDSTSHPVTVTEPYHQNDPAVDNIPPESVDGVNVNEHEESFIPVPSQSSEAEEREKEIPTKPTIDESNQSSAPGSDEVEEEEEEPAVIEHPEMVKLRETDASRPSIQHPSWNRDESRTLLDLIRRQSSTVKKTEEDLGAEDAEGVSAVPAEAVAEKTSSENSFELV